jgi:hypothetical protein
MSEPPERDAVVRGTRPSAEMLRWRAAAAEITPAKSLERIETKSTFVFSNVALIGTILTGLGVLTGVSSRLIDYRSWTRAVAGLLVGALVCALAASLPSLRSRMQTQDLKAVARYYTVNIYVRGWLTRVALLLFSTAFVIALGLLVVVSNDQVQPAVGLQWTDGGAGKRGLIGRVSAKDLPPGTRADTRLVAIDAQGSEKLIARDVSYVGGAGTLEVNTTIEEAPAAASFKLSTSVTSRGKASLQQSVELRL